LHVLLAESCGLTSGRIAGPAQPGQEQVAAKLFQTHTMAAVTATLAVEIEARQMRVPGSGRRHPWRVGIVPRAPQIIGDIRPLREAA